MHEFLRSIADGYFRSEGLNMSSYTFVFPNSRSARWFSSYLSSRRTFEDRTVRAMCLTMTELFEKGAGFRRASRNRLLMTVYKAYCRVAERRNLGFRPEEFDRFRFWAEMLIKDFDEADRYLVNPSELFRNVSDYKEIQTFYLTEEQQRIIRDFWGNDPYWGRLWPEQEVSAKADSDLPFWAHVKGADGEPVRRFSQLWELLGEIYTEFGEALRAKGLCYPGMACREVVRRLKVDGRLPFNPKKYVFIGFNRLTMAEHVVFDELMKQGMAHFYWDYDPALMNPERGNKAGRFIAAYCRHFTPALEAVALPPGGGRHKVEVIGVASNVGQAKVAARLLEHTDTAVVLPSDDVLLPLVASIPEEFTRINVTMGYPLRYSLLSQLYSSLAAMQIRARRPAGRPVEFFRNDVMRLLAGPLLRSVCAEECEAVRTLMKERRLFNLPADALADISDELPTLGPLLTPVADLGSLAEVAGYTRRCLDIIESRAIVKGIERAAIDTLRGQIDEIEQLADELDVRMNENTFFHLLEKAVFQRSLPLSGATFEAMQIMGVLETRCLGFRNVMMLSMTDSVFPGRNVAKSFIPESLRRAYGMPTVEHYESDSAYHFYRILSHADNLTLLYDSRTGGLRSGEKSRFIEQLLHVGFPGVEISCRHAVFASDPAGAANQTPLIPADTEIRKDERIMERLNRYLDPAQRREWKLSASSLKTYIHCPFQFYLERVEDIRPDDPPKENIDAGTIGNIIHETAERLFKELPVDNVTESVVENIINGGFDGLLEREVRRSFNANYVGIPRTLTDPLTGETVDNPEVILTPLHGEAAVYEPIIRRVITDMLRAEPVPFRFVAGELSRTFSWPLKNGLSLNFTMKIDRVDEKAGVIRLVDYKTGADKTAYTSVDQLFKPFSTDMRAAIFQLYTYSMAYLHLNPQVDPSRLQPLVYTLKQIPLTGTFGPLTCGKSAVESYETVRAEFEPMFNALIAEIFDPEVPFRRSPDDKVCKYCNFKRICHIDSL